MQRIKFILFLIPILAISCINLSDSKNEIIYETISPNGAKKAILFIKSGGATVGNSYQISLLNNQSKLKNSVSGNVFVADDPDGSINSDTSRVKLNWINPNTLYIFYDKKLRVFKSNEKVEDITIVYNH